MVTLKFRLLAGATAVAFILSLSACLSPDKATVSDAEADASSAASGPEATVEAWIAAYPFQAETDRNNLVLEPSPSSYGGSVHFERSELMPELLVNFKGSGFGVEYLEDRGHAYSMKDLTLSKRVTAKTPGSCINCKSGAIGEIFVQRDWSYAMEPLQTLIVEAHPPINCANCHDLGSGHLAAKQPGFLEALARTGKNFDAAPASLQSAYACAQCHSEYYFEPATNRVIHPWDQGLRAADMYAYYAAQPGGFSYDFIQPDSGTRLLKAQHPDFEEYMSGVHAAAGVSCADCHMAKVEVDGVIKTSHHITSPLNNVQGTCGACHTDKTPEWLMARVRDTQDTVFAAQRSAGQALATAHEAIAAGSKADVPATRLDEARRLLREGQWFWDYVASGNSMGFHAPVAALGNLAKATELAYQAIVTATRR